MFTSILASVSVAVLLAALWKVLPNVIKSLFSPLRALPGPPSDSLFFGNLNAINNAENSVIHEEWLEKYGDTIAYSGLFNIRRLFTVDTRALNHVLTHSMDYQRSEEGRYHLARVVGPGVLVTEGEQHRRQRRVMNPAFGPAQIRDLTEIFVEKSVRLRDVWAAELAKTSGPLRIDVLSWLNRATLDIIGLAGFNYKFNALNPDGPANELSQAFNAAFGANVPRLFLFLQATIPLMRLIRTQANRRSEQSQKVMRRIGLQLIAEKKAAILADSREKSSAAKDGVERKDVHGRDLLTLLIKANMASDIPESQRLTDDEVLAQVPTFIVAGHETTSSATTWCLFSLAEHPDIQRKLREELLTMPTDSPTMDEIMSLPYLEMVVKEVMRYHSPVPMTNRVATKDDLIPLNKPFTDKRGQVHDSIPISKGDPVMIPILVINRSKALWGEDAHEFKPERWENTPEAISSIPGVWSHILSFLGGPRSCIGYRFSLVEMKALIFTLVRAFEFELAVPVTDIKKKSTIVQRPFLISEPKGGSQMPLIIKPYRPL